MARPDNPALAASPSAGETLSAFWAWWTTRLAECVPGSVRAWFAGREQSIVIAWEGDALVLKRVSASGQVSGAIAHAAVEVHGPPRAEDFATAMKTLASRVRGRVTLAIGEERVLRKPLKLPLAARENLRTVIGYDIDRLTPFVPGSVLFDAAESRVDPSNRTVDADFAAAPRAPIEALVAAAQRAGLAVDRVVPTAHDAAGALNLLRSSEAVEQRAWYANAHLWLALLTGALLAAVLIFPLWQKREQVIAAQPVMAQAERDAAEADKLMRELQLRTAQYNFLPAKRHTTPLSVQVLDEVTKLLPEDTWVQTFELKTIRSTTASGGTTSVATRELQLQGESASSAKLINLFENTTLFGTPQFKSPLTKLNYPGLNVSGDRFHIAMEVKGAPLPALVPITMPLVAAAPPASTGASAPAAVPPVPAGSAKTAASPANGAATPPAVLPVPSPATPATPAAPAPQAEAKK